MNQNVSHENELARSIVDIAYRIHVGLGPGLLESVYEAAMAYEFDQAGMEYLRQAPFHARYGKVTLPEVGFRLDFLVESRVIVEIKSVEQLRPVHFKTTLTYLRQTGRKLGLLVNFNNALIRDGVHRIVNGLED